MPISKRTAIGFIAGNQEAIEKVYLEYKNLMYFVIAAYVKNQDDCDDVLSEAFLKAVEHKDQLIDFMKKNRALPSSDLIEEIYVEE